MDRPKIRALIQDGPRAGEDFMVDVAEEGHPPPEILLPDTPDGDDSPSPGVSTYHLAGTGNEAEGYPYHLVH